MVALSARNLDRMSRTDAEERDFKLEKLDAGASFPGMTLAKVLGDEIALPDDISSRYEIVLFYRGHW